MLRDIEFTAGLWATVWKGIERMARKRGIFLLTWAVSAGLLLGTGGCGSGKTPANAAQQGLSDGISAALSSLITAPVNAFIANVFPAAT